VEQISFELGTKKWRSNGWWVWKRWRGTSSRWMIIRSYGLWTMKRFVQKMR